jgi:hypothetical protein
MHTLGQTRQDGGQELAISGTLQSLGSPAEVGLAVKFLDTFRVNPCPEPLWTLSTASRVKRNVFCPPTYRQQQCCLYVEGHHLVWVQLICLKHLEDSLQATACDGGRTALGPQQGDRIVCCRAGVSA